MANVNPDVIFREMCAVLNISENQASKTAIGQAMNRALIDMRTQKLYHGVGLEMDSSSGAYSSLDLGDEYGLVFRQLTEWHLQQSPFWTKDRTLGPDDRRRALADGRLVHGYTWTGPNGTYE